MKSGLQLVTFTDKGHLCLLRAVKKRGWTRAREEEEKLTARQMSLLGNSTWKCCGVKGKRERDEREREVRRTRGHS